MSLDLRKSFECRPIDRGVNLYVYSTPKFKKTLVKVFIYADLDENATAISLIAAMLTRGSKTLPTMRDISVYLESLYGANYDCDAHSYGESLCLDMTLSILNDKYTLKGESLLARGFELLRDCLFEPALEDGIFNPDFFEQEKVSLQRFIESLFDNKEAWARFRCIEEMCRGERYALNEAGNLEDLENITPKSLTDFYRQLAHNHALDVYVLGDLTADSAEAALRQSGSWTRQSVKAQTPTLVKKPGGGNTNIVLEQESLEQAKLVFGLRNGIDYRHPLYFGTLLWSGLLGAFNHSKLFVNVREKQSLCYGIHSRQDFNKGLAFIQCGIDGANYQKTVDAVQQELKDLRDGNISADEFALAKRSLANYYRGELDSPGSMLWRANEYERNGVSRNYAKQIEGVETCKLEDVISAAQSTELEQIYCLMPEDPSPL